MTRHFFIAIAIVGVAVGGRTGEALAETLGSFAAVVPIATTDWTNGTLSFPQFNPASGTLTAVTITLSSTLETHAQRNEPGQLEVVGQCHDRSAGERFGPRQ